MFSLDIVDSDTFLDLPISSQALYFHLGMRADDRGYVAKARAVIKMIGASLGDLEALVNKKFVLLRDNGLILIKGWKINNCIQPTRLVETTYTEDLMKLFYDENNSYTEKPTNNPVLNGCQQLVNKVSTQDSIGKNSIGYLDTQESIENEEILTIPTLEEIDKFCIENNLKVNPKKFFLHYESTNWKIGERPIRDWTSVLRAWEYNSKKATTSSTCKVAGKPDWLEEYERNFMDGVENL
jgi:hypothetical protein